jgi:hypothetical protein
VVAAAERTELLERLRRIVLTDHVEDAQLPEALMQLLASLCKLQTPNTIAHRIDRRVMRREADRHAVFDLRAQAMQRIRQIARRERRTHCRHTATDIDADRARDDCSLRRNHRTNSCALAEMHIRHYGHMSRQDRQRRNVAQLLNRFPLDFDPRGPRLQVVDLRLFLEAHDTFSYFE